MVKKDGTAKEVDADDVIAASRLVNEKHQIPQEPYPQLSDEEAEEIEEDNQQAISTHKDESVYYTTLHYTTLKHSLCAPFKPQQ